MNLWLIGGALGAGWLLFGKKMMPAPAVIPVPPPEPVAPGQLPNYAIAGSAATASDNLATYLAAKGCDNGMTDLVRTFQHMHNVDPKGQGPASALRDMTGPLVESGSFDAKTAVALGLYTNTIDPFFQPCDQASTDLVSALNSSAQALFARLSGGCISSPFHECRDFQSAYNAIGLRPVLTDDGLYGRNTELALTVTIAAMLNPSTMTAPAACV